MRTLGQLTRRGLRSPTLQFLLVILLLLVALGLGWRLVVMADHTTAMLGACFVVIAVAALLLNLPVPVVALLPRSEGASPVEPPRLILTRGRHPPDDGTVLLD